MPVDRQRWTPPQAPERSEHARVPGALGGSMLWDQPAQAADRARLEAFVAPGPPLAVEVGFDHGISLLAQARARSDWRWLGVELRKRRVAAVQDHAPANCLALRADARTLFAALLPAGRVDRVDILFPTPTDKGRHLLLTADLAADLARVLSPDGVVHLQTDVPAMATLFDACFAGWPARPHPPAAPELSRRQRVAQRDRLPVWVRTVGRPEAP